MHIPKRKLLMIGVDLHESQCVEKHCSILSCLLLVSHSMPLNGKGWSALRRARNHESLSKKRNNQNCRQSPESLKGTDHIPGTSDILQRLLDLEKAHKGEYKHQLHNDQHKLGRAQETEVTMRLKVLEAELSMGEVQEGLARADRRIDDLKRDNNRLRICASRADDCVSRVVEVERESSLEENRVIRDGVHNMVRELASLNVSVEHVVSVIHAVAKGVGVRVTDSLGLRSVRRIVLEGKVAGDIQLIHKMSTAKSKFVNLYIVYHTNYIHCRWNYQRGWHNKQAH